MANIEELIHRIQSDMKQIERDLARLELEEKLADEQREGSPFGKREEGATETYERQKRIALKNKLSGNLFEMKKAIDKYNAGLYGICEMCQKPIESGRLEAMPHASLCLSCKSKQLKDGRIR